MYIKVKNSLDQDAQYSYLSNGEVSGTTSIRVKNINSFTPSWAVQIGKTGEEMTEIGMLGTGAISGTALTLATATVFEHPTDTPIYAIKYDKIIVKRSTTGTAGTAVALATVSIVPDSYYTLYEETSPSSTYAYKTQYLNSITSGTSTESDWWVPGGFTFYSLAKMRDRVKRKLVSAGYLKDDETIDDWINEWMETMTNTAIDVNQDYLLGTTTVSYSGTQVLGTIGVTDFKEERKLLITTNGSDYYTMTKMRVNDFQPDQTFAESHPYYYMHGDNVIGRLPADNSATIQLTYYKVPTNLLNDTDELPVSMQRYTKSFVNYALGQAYYLDNKLDRGDRYNSEAIGDMAKFRAEIAPRQKTGPQFIQIISPISAEDDYKLF